MDRQVGKKLLSTRMHSYHSYAGNCPIISYEITSPDSKPTAPGETESLESTEGRRKRVIMYDWWTLTDWPLCGMGPDHFCAIPSDWPLADAITTNASIMGMRGVINPMCLVWCLTETSVTHLATFEAAQPESCTSQVRFTGTADLSLTNLSCAIKAPFSFQNLSPCFRALV